ncbi:MAG: DNA-directed RNA polymerase subunit beta [Rhodospirillaceae bacterium]|nr:DNA-directed RNA polymerase subunit beta [Rhodospirillaceae bacterium]
MALSFTGRKRVRKNFGRIPEVTTMPNLIEVQKTSYAHFLQMDVSAEQRTDTGLQEVFKSVFPIRDFSDRAQLDFVRYEFDRPKYDVEECQQRGMTYAAPLRVTLRLIVWDVDEDTGARTVRDIKEQDVFMGDMPLMTDKGTFVINGTERVIVSQMHRSPGVFFDHDRGKTHSSGKYLFAARIIPYRGSWLDFEFDAKDILFVRIDRRRKLPVGTLLRALYMSTDDIFDAFYNTVVYNRDEKGWKTAFDPSRLRGTKLIRNLVDAKTGKVMVEAGTRVTARVLKGLEAEGLTEQMVTAEDLVDHYVARDVINEETGEIYAEAGDILTIEQIQSFEEAGVTELPTLAIDHVTVGPYIRNTLAMDKNLSREDALTDIYRVMRPGEPPTEESAERLFYDLFLSPVKAGKPTVQARQTSDPSSPVVATLNKGDLDGAAWVLDVKDDQILVALSVTIREDGVPAAGVWMSVDDVLVERSERYDLSAVGRVKMNGRLNLTTPDNIRELRCEDVVAVLRTLVDLKDGRGEIDDIDHLGNRRVRSVGELMENQYRIGLLRMERAIRERMSSVDIDAVMPHDLINAKPAAAAVREFFGSSQLSQFMDQTNPLSEITHKRRLSALGPGGLTRERAGFEVRDVHPTHYGRICPIETPEGPNIGLINSLATYARVNQYGFIESPYRRVAEGRVTDEVVYLSAMEEGKYTIAQANAELTEDARFARDLVSCRRNGDFVMSAPDAIEFIDVSPKQLVSVAAALIPFLENDDANRALMGSNMQRQAVPLIRAEAPLVGTGMEEVVARDSGSTVAARRDGIIDQVDAERIVIRATDGAVGSTVGVDIYNLLKFQRSNQNTCINQRPLVKVGDVVKAGDVIADGPSTELGDLALGRNVLVAFMPWQGYNFEDSILISERIVSDDVFTSIHIEEFEVMSRDTKLGPEEITRDIPNVGEEALRNLDEAGIVYIGAEVKPGDILVGKITPKGESPMTPEEKLLRAIFGEKASDVRDTSLRLPPGVSGTVVEVRVFSRRGVDKDERALAIEREEIDRLAKDRDDERLILERNIYGRLRDMIRGHKTTAGPKGMDVGTEVSDELLGNFSQGQWWQIAVDDEKVMAAVEELKKELDDANLSLQARFDEKVGKVQAGDELLPGVLKMVKVFIAVKRKLQPGDKMAGRHGNKGVISRIVPAEDMPYLEDGTPVDVVLNPLGVPSRMNVGQILETHLGWAAARLGSEIGDLVDAVKRGSSVDALRKRMGEVYDGDSRVKEITTLDDTTLIEMGGHLRDGVPIATPVFDGAREEDIVDMLQRAGLNSSGQVTLVDGRTGEPFARKVTVGYIYMLKLHHLVDDKIHARSVGPYSLVTQQPLGGKAQFGGQRFGEMEVWALQAYGAAYTLQEMLTVKSDDVSGRTKVYEAIVRGEDTFEAGIPESFNVLVKELQSLGLDVDLAQS